MVVARTFAQLLVAVAVFVSARVAEAQDTAQARRLFEEGVAHADAHRWEDAAEAFARSSAIAERPSTVFNHAVALAECGRSVDARVRFARLLQLTDLGAAERDTARRRIADIDRRLTPIIARVLMTWARSRGAPSAHSRLIIGMPSSAQTRTSITSRETSTPTPLPGGGLVPAQEGRSIFDDWPFWVITGVVLAVAVPVAIALSSSGRAGIDGGSTGIVLMP